MPRGGEVIISRRRSPAARASVDVAPSTGRVKGWSKVRYDPNRLIHGAQEEGFVELEEISMKDSSSSSLTPKPAADFGRNRRRRRPTAPDARACGRGRRRLDAVKGWSAVRRPPRLIQGAQEAGSWSWRRSA